MTLATFDRQATGWWSREDGAVAVGVGGSCSPAAFASMPVSHSVPWLRFRFPLIEPDVRISRIRLSDWISREGSRGCTQTQSADLSDPKLFVDPLDRKLLDAAPMSHLVSSPEKVAHASNHVLIHGSIPHEPGPMAEVVCPPPQDPVQLAYHFGPWLLIPRPEHLPHRLLHPPHALLRRLGREIPVAILAAPFRPVGVAKEVETLLVPVHNSCLGLVQSESDPSHHLPRPFQRLGRSAAAQDDEIIGVVDESRSKLFSLPLPPPVLEKAVHVEVGD